MNEDLLQPQTHYWDQDDLSDLQLDAILKRRILYIIFVQFEVYHLSIAGVAKYFTIKSKKIT